jgi:Cytochrome c554 and c-prime
MHRRTETSAWGLVGAFALACLLCGSCVLAQTRASQTEAVGKYTGPGSCASTSCHGSVLPRTENDVLQNEYSIWIVQDKHSRAYDALTGTLGRRIASILRLGQAETAPRCLACHSLDPPPAERSRSFDLSEGVSCETCHGPASGWLGPHTERGFTYEKSVVLGMCDLRDITKRTEKCLGCHLGSEEKYVDHEMIAAGHPMLQFELDSFSAVMPRHWKATATPLDPERSDPLYDVREMTTGEAVHLRQSLLWLAARTRGKVWPEYSELECEACHHSLTPPEESWRQARGYPGRRPGDPPWNASRYTVFREVAHELDGADAEQLDSGIAQLVELMSRLDPDRDQVASTATRSAHAADALAAKMRSANYDRALALHLLQKISGDADEISAAGEQSAAQAAMVLQSLFVACDRNEKLSNSTEVRAAITGLFDQLQNLSAYDPARFAAEMRRVNGLVR